jgi:hypothetical protein
MVSAASIRTAIAGRSVHAVPATLDHVAIRGNRPSDCAGC